MNKMLSPTKPSGNSCSLVLTLFFPLCKAWENLCSHSTTSQNNNKGLALSKTYTDYIRGFFFFQSITRQSFSLFLENGSVHMLSNLCKHNWAHCFVFETSNIVSSDAHRGLSASRKLITTEE